MENTLKNKKLIQIIFLMTIIIFSACKKLVTVDSPINQPDAKEVYANDASATAVLTGIYSKLSSSSSNSFLAGTAGVSLFSGLSSDELIAYSSSSQAQQQFYKNSLTNSSTSYPWTNCYFIIYSANAALTGISASNSLSVPVVKQLTGEAKFIRALSYFYLVNYYGDVPLILTTDFTKNNMVPRTPKAQVWQQVISDLKDAQSLLSENFVANDLAMTTQERTRPNKWAATALLARAYLYNGDYANAESTATAVINNTSLFSLEDLHNVFLMNNNEAIWQLQPVVTGENTPDGKLFILRSAPANQTPVSLSSSVVNAFEPDDQRKTAWVNSIQVSSQTYYFPFKYQVGTYGTPVTEYENVLRLGEQYLIRAEARTQLGTNIIGAQNDLNEIRTRAGLPNTIAADKASLLVAVAHERQVELFAEGHRWFDLKRTAQVTPVMTAITPLKGGGAWNDNKQLYPINIAELQTDYKLVQNPGY